MNEEERKELLKELESKIKSIITDSTKENVSAKDLNSKIADINKTIADNLNNEEMAELKKSVDTLKADLTKANEAATAQGLVIAGLNENASKKEEKPVTFKQAIRNAIMEKKDLFLTEKNDDYGKRLSMKDYFTEKGNQQSPTFTIKAAVDMLQSNIVQSEVNLVRLTELDPQRVGIPLTIYPHVLDWMPKKGIRKANMSVLVVYSYEDGSGTKTEGTASSKSSFLLKTIEYKAFYLATYFTLSDETLDDLDEVMDEIAITAPDKILDKIDTKILGTTGDGATDIAGLYTANNHTDFATVTYTDTVDGANIIDLISKAKLQAEANKYRPNVVSMHPTDVDNMASLKDANDNSVMDRRVKWDNLGNPAFVFGMRIIASTAQAVNTLSVSDQKQLIIGNRKDMTMEIGFNGTDLTEGQKTVVIKIRLAFGVRDKAAVIYSDDIATDVAAINKL
jgi:hypothetical protein